MLKKLLKYDLRSLCRYCVPLLIAMLAGTVLGMVCLPLIVRIAELIPTLAEEASMLFVFVMMFCVFGIFGAFLLVGLSAGLFQIMICVDFYKSLITDEGYLTFTLPVKRRDILFSKLINGIFWSLISVVAATVSITLIIVSLFLFTDVPWPSGEGLREFLSLFGLNDLLTLLNGILYVFLSLISGLLLYFTAIFLGSVIAKKHKLMVSIGCILGANFIYSTVIGIITSVVEFFAIAFGVSLGLGDSPLMFQMLFGVLNVITAMAAVLLFFWLYRMMERRLNLA